MNEEVIVLEDDEGNELLYIILDQINLEDHHYLVLQANGRSQILILEEDGDDLDGVEEEIAALVFEAFKERNQDKFNFQ